MTYYFAKTYASSLQMFARHLKTRSYFYFMEMIYLFNFSSCLRCVNCQWSRKIKIRIVEKVFSIWLRISKTFYVNIALLVWNNFDFMNLYGIKQNKLLFEFKSCKNGHNEGVIFYSTAICNPNLFYLTAMNYDLWMKQKNFYAYHL